MNTVIFNRLRRMEAQMSGAFKRGRQFIASMLTLAALGGITSGCDSMIYDEEGDCSVHYRVSFSYDTNILFADAFASQVKSLTLYVVDANGNIITSQTGSGEALAQPGYYMEVDVRPGNYDLFVWAQGESPVQNHTAFSIGGAGSQTISAYNATLPLSGPAPALISDKDIVPLFHGMMRKVSFPDTYGNVDVATVNLTKDTNLFKVLIQSIDGTVIDPGEFSFCITGDNSEMSYLNEVVSVTPFNYVPWNVTHTTSSYDKPETARAGEITEVTGLLAELTTGRLMVNRRQNLIIHRNSDDTDVIRINLLEYLLMVKGEYNARLSDQQYLDRMDAHTLMFFLDADRNWYTAGGIYINGWRIVPKQEITLE